MEHAVFNGCDPSIGFFDGDLILNFTSIAGTSLFVNGVTLTANAAAPSAGLTMWRADNPNPPGKIIADDLTLNGPASEYRPSTLSDNHTVEPLLNRHPTAARQRAPASERRIYGPFVMVAAGTTGHLIYRCIQNAGAYQWLAQ